MRERYYKLVGHNAVPCDLHEWGRSFEDKEARTVARDEIGGDVLVSTVFLGLDHRMLDKGPPILFETMVFGGPLDQEQERCSTWNEAEKMHLYMIRRVKDAIGGPA